MSDFLKTVLQLRKLCSSQSVQQKPQIRQLLSDPILKRYTKNPSIAAKHGLLL
jgi:hypothetical protein